MLKLNHWLTRPFSGWSAARFTLLMLLADFVLSLGVILVLFSLGWHAPTSTPIENSFARHAWWFNVGLFILAPPFEELIFRLLPLGLAHKFQASPRVMITTAIVASVLFGLAHRDLFGLILRVPGALLLCLVFLKCGGGAGQLRRGWFWSSADHLGYNSIALALSSV